MRTWVYWCVLGLSACALETDVEGEATDEVEYDAMLRRGPGYTIPTEVPELVAPEVIVSLDAFTIHLFDRATGFSRVYPTGIGAIGSSGKSITPVGRFKTGSNTRDSWWYMDYRWSPDYYMGLPFLRITIPNSRGSYSYGFHGPVTSELQVGYVSNGCMRMRPNDIIELYWIMKQHPGASIVIQREPEIDRAGNTVAVGRTPALYAIGETISYGASVGGSARPRGFIGDACERDQDCGGYSGASGVFCHDAGFCTQLCAGYCPDVAGKAPTFCTWHDGESICVSKAGERNMECALVDGTMPAEVDRYVGSSSASAARARVCLPAM